MRSKKQDLDTSQKEDFGLLPHCHFLFGSFAGQRNEKALLKSLLSYLCVGIGDTHRTRRSAFKRNLRSGSHSSRRRRQRRTDALAQNTASKDGWMDGWVGDNCAGKLR